MDNEERLRLIADHVRLYGEPHVVTLNEMSHGPNCHVFMHGNASDIDDLGVIFINKNGNFFRAIKQWNGRWLLVKTWNGIFESQGWMQTSLERNDPMELIKLATGKSGPTRLALLPREACAGPRRAVFGEHIIRAHMMQARDSFNLVLRDGTENTFNGKLWESAEAVAWCHANVGRHSSGNGKPNELTVTYEEVVVSLPANIPQFAAAEDNPLWGQF